VNEASRSLELTAARTPGLGAAMVQRLFCRLERGRLTVVLPDGAAVTHRGPLPGQEAQLELRSWKPLRALLLGGDNGFAESYIAGDWSSPDLAAFLRFGAENMAALKTEAGGTWGAQLTARLRHWRNRNSRAGSRRNILAHYDLGNSFYACWLDASMTYSSALYAAPEEDLADAQARKLKRIAELLHAGPGADVLEIGCGWGALAEQLASGGARVTGLTLSPAQAQYARARLAAAGLEGRAEIVLRDYRDASGVYDRIVSIEMLEAVGEAWWPAYFAGVRARLKPAGRAVLQVITIDEALFDNYRRHPDFIQLHVFPGGMLLTKSAIAAQAARVGLMLTRTDFFGQSYALTLAEWRRRFLRAWPTIEREERFAPPFKRLWEYYLAYCEAGFVTGMTDVGLYVLERAP